MKDELSKEKNLGRSLDERFAKRPHTYARLQEIADLMDQAIEQGASADEAEAMTLGEIRKLGRELLQDWAQATNDKVSKKAREEHPQSSKHFKKK